MIILRDDLMLSVCRFQGIALKVKRLRGVINYEGPTFHCKFNYIANRLLGTASMIRPTV